MPHYHAEASTPGKRPAESALRRVALDLIAMALFLTVMLATNDTYLATIVGVTASLARVAWLKVHRHPVDPLQWLSLGLIIVLGTVTILTRDARFVMLKPSIVEACIGVFMLRPGWCMSYTPPRFRPLVPRGLMVAWGYVWAAAMLALAASNLLVAQLFAPRTWALYVALSPIALVSLLSAAGIPLFVAAAKRGTKARQSAGGMPATERS